MESINREYKLDYLRRSYREKKSQFVVLYGKRRVGKTSLMKEFAKGVPHIYFLADKATEKDQLLALSERVGLHFDDEFLLSRGFGTWYEFFRRPSVLRYPLQRGMPPQRSPRKARQFGPKQPAGKRRQLHRP